MHTLMNQHSKPANFHDFIHQMPLHKCLPLKPRFVPTADSSHASTIIMLHATSFHLTLSLRAV